MIDIFPPAQSRLCSAGCDTVNLLAVPDRESGAWISGRLETRRSAIAGRTRNTVERSAVSGACARPAANTEG